MNYKRETQVGVLFVVGLLLLLVLTISISRLGFLQPHYDYTVIFESVAGLRKDDPVQVSGFEMGKVASLELLPDTTIKVILRLSQPVKLYADYDIRIEESSMIGGNYVYIAPGTPTEEVAPGEILEGSITRPGLDELGQFMSLNAESIKKLIQDGGAVFNKILNGEGSLGKLVNDDALYDNLKDVSESLKKVSAQLEAGKGPLGKLLFDEKISDQLSQSADAATKVLSPVVNTRVFAGVDSKYYRQSDLTATRLALQIYPHPYRYFSLGATILTFDKDGVIDFEDKITKDRDQTFIKPDIQLAYLLESKDHWFTFRPGLLEGKAGLGIDWDIPVTATGLFPLTLTVEGRDAYNDVEDEDIDENLKGGLFRAYATFKINRYFKIYAGANRLFNRDNEFMFGLSFSYPDEDIKNFIVLLGLSR